MRLIPLLVLVSLLLYSCSEQPKVEEYEPGKPKSDFSHELHAGKLQIDCKYCHNSATKEKQSGLATVNVCMNCHKKVGSDGTTIPDSSIIKENSTTP